MTKEKLLKATNSGEIKLKDIVLKVHVLDDGRRVIDEEDEENVNKFFEYLSNPNPNSKQASEEELMNLGKFIKNLKELMNLRKLIKNL